jgi:hypothetical protein
MNPGVKSAWIAALKSGAYQQTQHHLRDQDGYCCLGVLCDLASHEDLGKWEDGEFSFVFISECQEEEYVEPPFDIREWANLSREDCDKLSKLNDDGRDFVEIATVIEREL